MEHKGNEGHPESSSRRDALKFYGTVALSSILGYAYGRLLAYDPDMHAWEEEMKKGQDESFKRQERIKKRQEETRALIDAIPER